MLGSSARNVTKSVFMVRAPAGARRTICGIIVGVFTAVLTVIAGTATVAQTQKASQAEPVRMVLDRPTLALVEAKGWSFNALMSLPTATALDGLGEGSPLYADLVRQLGDDVKALRSEMAANRRPLFEVTDGNVGRILDLRWLASPLASFRLVGIINRTDRRDFTALTSRPSCGEVRLIYRLAYRFHRGKAVYASRLPLNLNVVFDVPAASGVPCPNLARSWTPPRLGMDGSATSEWLVSGPLAGLVLRQIEVNAQVVRLPSGMETEFGGQAIYLMRVFGVAEGRAIPKPLENTPDVARLAADAALKARLVEYVRANLAAIDTGVYQIPGEFLAQKAFSFSTFGSNRTANHPFASLFTPKDFESMPLAQLGYVASPAGLIARLDDGTCTGCHQGAATAGFHLIGYDEADTAPFNIVKVPISPHLHAEDARRRAYLRALSEGRPANPFRPLSFAPAAQWGDGDRPVPEPAAATMACLLPEATLPFHVNWACAPDLACAGIAKNPRLPVATGQCMPQQDKRLVSGMACLSGEIIPGKAPYLDSFRILRQINSHAVAVTPSSYNCRPAKLGVPGGAAYRQCSPADRAFAGFSSGRAPPEICALVGGKAFDLCVATDNFAQCMDASVVRGNRPTCGAGRFCREDFMCQALPPTLPGAAAISADNGFCSPTYFVFQMRIDGHPDPVRGVK